MFKFSSDITCLLFSTINHLTIDLDFDVPLLANSLT